MANKVGKQIEFKKLTATLSEFAASLPTELEKQELDRSVSTIIEFLTRIQRLGAMTPSCEDTAAIENALRTLDHFSERAKDSPAIAMLLGVPQPRPSRPKNPTYSSEETARAEQLSAEMQTLPIDQMRSRLQDESNVSLRMLQAIASRLGIRSVQRMGRDVLEHQIASKISNYRGYQGLRAGTEGA